MYFGANKTPIEVIKEGAFGGTYFGDIYSGITGKWQRKSWKELNQLKILIESITLQIIKMSVSINKVLNVEHRQDFGKIRYGLMKQILMVVFSGILGARQVEDQKMRKGKLIDEKKL